MRCSERLHMSEYAARRMLLFLALYSPQRITQSLPETVCKKSYFRFQLGGEAEFIK